MLELVQTVSRLCMLKLENIMFGCINFATVNIKFAI